MVTRTHRWGPVRRIMNIVERQGEVERTDLTVPAELRQVRVLRLVVAGTLSLLDVGTDVVEDIRSAVDEACGLVLGKQGAPGWLTLTLLSGAGKVSAEVCGTFSQLPDREPEATQLAESMLRLFVDSCEIDLEHHRVTFERPL